MGNDRLNKAAKAAGYALATSNELLGIRPIVTTEHNPNVVPRLTRGELPMLALPAPSEPTLSERFPFFGALATWKTSRA